jgi:hypothetical protein
LKTAIILLPSRPACALLERVSIRAVSIRDPHHRGRNDSSSPWQHLSSFQLPPNPRRQIPPLRRAPPPIPSAPAAARSDPASVLRQFNPGIQGAGCTWIPDRSSERGGAPPLSFGMKKGGGIASAKCDWPPAAGFRLHRVRKHDNERPRVRSFPGINMSSTTARATASQPFRRRSPFFRVALAIRVLGWQSWRIEYQENSLRRSYAALGWVTEDRRPYRLAPAREGRSAFPAMLTFFCTSKINVRHTCPGDKTSVARLRIRRRRILLLLLRASDG